MANEKMLIDADKIYYAVERRYIVSCGIEHQCARDFLDLICEAPTVDAVEVVRCRDCEHYKWIPNFGRLMCTNFRGLAIAKPDDFCPYGERKDCDD